MLRGLAPYCAYGFLSLVGWTSRLRRVGLEHERSAHAEGRGVIYAFWHQRQAFLTYTHRRRPIHVLVSRSRDGEIIAETMRLSGIPAVRGSSSRGAQAAARELLERLERREDVGITPDGPRGPARDVKPGVLYLAQRSGAAILPTAAAVRPSLELARAWDRFHVPLPFGRACLAYAEPVFVRPDDDLKAKAAELREGLDRATKAADRGAS